ncbi:FkbM family methyltransferase [Pedobacter sp. BMA]|uniref:FkbM family methyltransferase n=1 Tax=Pedobacter sp. BMA TaxID=1663685 RepID=UPI00064B59CA|nr:FkbM family methyltransferase [Pedobacter sp. BMA]KLT66641.1 hypothetical protein AB669_05570 [Pedobacter sp. BMA]
MILKNLYRYILRRQGFKGQFRIFAWLFDRGKLGGVKQTVLTLKKDFRVNVDTYNFIEASIYYMGDYEPWVKKHFKRLIRPGDVVLDVGANIGFHSLYFSTLTGPTGKVIAVEPINQNFVALQKNIGLNGFDNIINVQKALANETKEIQIHIDPEAKNPGAFSLLEQGVKNTGVSCIKGDDLLNDLKINTVNFIKIDVEGYELEALKGLSLTVAHSRPVIIFEYDRAYQLKAAQAPDALFLFLQSFNYRFECIDGYGNTRALEYDEALSSAEIIAYPL